MDEDTMIMIIETKTGVEPDTEWVLAEELDIGDKIICSSSGFESDATICEWGGKNYADRVVSVDAIDRHDGWADGYISFDTMVLKVLNPDDFDD